MMTPSEIQIVLNKAGYYNGVIDGILGRESAAGIQKVLKRNSSLVKGKWESWPLKRQGIAAAQLIMRLGFGKNYLDIDGLYGNQTAGALLEWMNFFVTGKILNLPREATRPLNPDRFKNTPLQSECPAIYGKNQVEVESQLVYIDLPYPMRLDWDLNQIARRARVHKKVADSAVNALLDIQIVYGDREIKRLGLDRTAGTYIWRTMRGGSALSMHSYGIAWDFYAGPNGLTTQCPQALFCKSDYDMFFNIWEENGWVSLGREIGRDWMHVQHARLR